MAPKEPNFGRKTYEDFSYDAVGVEHFLGFHAKPQREERQAESRSRFPQNRITECTRV
jgi:hypothetical protein